MAVQLDLALVLLLLAIDEGLGPVGELTACQTPATWCCQELARLTVSGLVFICFLRLGFHLCRAARTVASNRRAVRDAAIAVKHDYTMATPSDGGQLLTSRSPQRSPPRPQTRAHVRAEVAARQAAREAEAAAARARERAVQRAREIKRTWLARKFGGLKRDALRMLLISLQLTTLAHLWPSAGTALAPCGPLTASQMVHGVILHTDQAAPSHSVQIDGLSDGDTQVLLQQPETLDVLMQLLEEVSPPRLKPPSSEHARALSGLKTVTRCDAPPPPPLPQAPHLGGDQLCVPEAQVVTPQVVTYQTMTGREATIVLSATNRTVLDLLDYVAASNGIEDASVLTCVARRLGVQQAEALCPMTPLGHLNFSASVTIVPQLSGAGRLKPLPKTPVGDASSLMAFGITKSHEPPPAPATRDSKADSKLVIHYPRWYPPRSLIVLRPTQHRLDAAIESCANSAKAPPRPKPKSGRGRPRGSCDSPHCARQQKKARTQAAKVAVKQASAADAVIASPAALTATLTHPAVASATTAAFARCKGVSSAIVDALAADSVTSILSSALSTSVVGEAVTLASAAGQTTPSAVQAMTIASIVTAALTDETVRSTIPKALSAPAVVDAVSNALGTEDVSSAVSSAIASPAVATAVAAALKAEAISAVVSGAIATPEVATAVAAAVHQQSIARTVLAAPAVALAITSGLTSAAVTLILLRARNRSHYVGGSDNALRESRNRHVMGLLRARNRFRIGFVTTWHVMGT